MKLSNSRKVLELNEKGERFKDNMDFENALTNFLGQRYYGSAGAFSSPRISRKFLLRALRRIRKRLDEIITNDERLILTTSIALERLEYYTEKTSEKVNNDWFIIANLLDLIALLLGYDWNDGEVHRRVIFYQDKNQEVQDFRIKSAKAFWDEFPYGDWRLRFEIVNMLKGKNLSNNQIARVLRMSDKLVAKILRRIEDFEKHSEKKFLEHSTKLPHTFFII